MDRRAIYEALARDAPHQEAALQQVAAEVWRALQPRRPSEGDAPRVCTALLSGVSGTGKTQVCERLRALLLAAPGQPYAHRALHCHLGGLGKLALTKFSGCSAGWNGFGAPTLAAQLRDACAPDARGEAPRCVLVQLDELDKAHPRVMDALNSLLDRGTLELTAELEQVRPRPETTLLLLFTANYGAGDLAVGDTLASVAHIKRAMRTQGLEDCDIGRLGTIVPFHAFEPQAMADILAAAHAVVWREHLLTQRHAVVAEPGLAEALTRAVLAHYDARLGARDALRLYRRELEEALDLVLLALERAPAPRVVLGYRRLAVDAPTALFAAAEHFVSRERREHCARRGDAHVELLVAHSAEGAEGAVLSACLLVPPPVETKGVSS